ncbi:MAG: 30S ribosomal protein S8 [Gemmatimonadota bacterium]|nr:30S ribosomal protein S8 [Gemmatimonadota bacterium]
MSMSDPIADMLTRIRNAAGAGHRKVDIPGSRLKTEIARIMKSSGFIHNYACVEDNRQGYIRLYLKYSLDDESAIQGLDRVSRPGLRRYVRVGEIPSVLNGLGVAILSTPQGILTDSEARRAGVGGEVLCHLW